MELENDGRIITAILPNKNAVPVLKGLAAMGITRINVANARGFDIGERNGKKGFPDEVEKEVLTVVATSQKQADELFEYIYHEAKINRPHGGIIYMAKLSMASIYTLPDLHDLANQQELQVKINRKPPEASI